MTTDYGPALSAAEAGVLRRVAGIMIPASEAFGVSFAEYTDPTGATARAPQPATTAL